MISASIPHEGFIPLTHFIQELPIIIKDLLCGWENLTQSHP